MRSKKKYTKLLWAVCGLSALSTVLLAISLYTERWIVSTAISYPNNKSVAEINYGLFSGMIMYKPIGIAYRIKSKLNMQIICLQTKMIKELATKILSHVEWQSFILLKFG